MPNLIKIDNASGQVVKVRIGLGLSLVAYPALAILGVATVGVILALGAAMAVIMFICLLVGIAQGLYKVIFDR